MKLEVTRKGRSLFTGIIEEVGSVRKIEPQDDAVRLHINGPLVVSDASHGDSIAVNGVCLTVTEFDDTGFWADVMQVTLDYTALGDLAEGTPVNLERALPSKGRLGGHIVQGHVDGTATLLKRTPSENWEIFEFQLDNPEMANLVVTKGSIAINGTSLTVAEVDGDRFEVSLIPTTLANTVLNNVQIGDRVNVEYDILAKYVQNLLPPR